MSIRPLARRYKVNAQLCNIPEVAMRRRCAFCYWRSYQNNGVTYAQCIKAHKCLSESLFWLALLEPEYEDDALSPTGIVRQVSISSAPRYAQLFSCDDNEYNCNVVCVYYNDRLVKKQSVAKCSSSHKCGRNGSGFLLLDFDLRWLFTCPVYDYLFQQSHRVYTLGGKAIELDDGIDLTYENGLVCIRDGYDSYPIVNFIPYKAKCGRKLATNGVVTASSWTFKDWLSPYFPNSYVPILSTTDDLYNYLIDLGVLPSIF